LDGKIRAKGSPVYEKSSTGSLRHRINEYDEYGESAFPGYGNALFNSTYEIKKLQKENEELRMENELLKNSRLS